MLEVTQARPRYGCRRFDPCFGVRVGGPAEADSPSVSARGLAAAALGPASQARRCALRHAAGGQPSDRALELESRPKRIGRF